MKTLLGRTVVATVCLLLCVAVGLFLLPAVWQGVSARDFRPSAANADALIFILALAFRVWLQWSIRDLLVGLLPFEVILLLCIAYFSGYTGLDIFDRFNLSWFFGLNLFVGLPWLAGIAIGSVVSIVTRRNTNAPAQRSEQAGTKNTSG